MNNQIIYFSKVRPSAKIPTKRVEDAAYDIYCDFEEDLIALDPHQTKMISTGIASACVDDYYFQLQERGSGGVKGIGLRAGVIDSGFRSEWKCVITNHNPEWLVIYKNHVNVEDIQSCYGENCILYPYEKAICQAVLIPVPKVVVKELSYEELKSIESARGMGMLGSSGK